MFRAIIAVCAAALLATGLAGTASADKVRSTPDERQSIALTIYNTNLGLVKEVRKLAIPKGVSDLWFEGVAAQIDPTSVHIRSLSAPDALAIIEQNFEYDLIAPDRLMEKYVGKDVELVRVLDGKEQRVPAKLIGTAGGTVYEIDGKIAINPPFGVVLPSLPEGLISKPSLVWQLESDKTEHTVEASYLTDGISWRANYVAVLSDDDKKLDLNGWVTLDNQSGATYDNATLKLVAGDVNRIGRSKAMAGIQMRSAVEEMPVAQFAEETFFEYHLYTLGRTTTVRDNQTKQISLLGATNVDVTKRFVYAPRMIAALVRRFPDPILNGRVGVYINVENSKKSGLGMPLPKGVVSVYKKDASDAMQFIGEDSIEHTPEDETFDVFVGNAFDIVVKRVQTNFEVLDPNHAFRSTHRITIRNHKKENVVVAVLEDLAFEWKITSASHDFEKVSSQRVRFDVPVSAKGEAELTYTAEVRK